MNKTAPAHKPNTSTLLPLTDYDHILVSYSGGKDSLACLLHVLELGADPAKVELWHQHVDGEPGAEGLMDWPCTEGYVRATGERFGLPVRFQWREGGFEREMLRHDQPTGDVYFEDGTGQVVHLPTTKATAGTRRKFDRYGYDQSQDKRWSKWPPGMKATIKPETNYVILKDGRRVDMPIDWEGPLLAEKKRQRELAEKRMRGEC